MKKSRPNVKHQLLYSPQSARKPPKKKSMDKSNITAKRLTLLPGFLTGGVKSQIVTKKEPHDYDGEVLRENLHGLLTGPPRRRSRRLLQKDPLTISGYLLDIIPPKSKSIIREIKEKYAGLSLGKVNQDFGTKLVSQVRPQVALHCGQFYKKEIVKEIDIVNKILSGELDSNNRMENSNSRKRRISGNDEENKENFSSSIKFPYVPQSKWVFQTPPNRKLNFNNVRVEENFIKPAILETCKEGTVIYEVNKKINVDLNKFKNKQEVDIDKRFMVKVGALPNTNMGSSQDFTFQCVDEEEEDANKFQSETFELENHFLSLTCRPKKQQVSVPRFPCLKRKRDIFEDANNSNPDESVNEFESNFTFINNNLNSLEESFTLKFTADDYAGGSATGHLFDFDGNKKDTFNFRY